MYSWAVRSLLRNPVSAPAGGMMMISPWAFRSMRSSGFLAQNSKYSASSIGRSARISKVARVATSGRTTCILLGYAFGEVLESPSFARIGQAGRPVLLAPCRGTGVDDGDQAVVQVGNGWAAGMGEQLAVQGGDEFLDLRLHFAHLLAHVEDDLHAGEVDAEIAGEVKDDLQAFQIVSGIEAGIAFAAGRLQQALALVEAERLRVDFVLLRHHGDHVCRLGFHLCHFRSSSTFRRVGPRGEAWPIRAGVRGCARRAGRVRRWRLRRSGRRAGWCAG